MDFPFLSKTLETEPLNSAYRAFVQKVSPDQYFQTAYALLGMILTDSLSQRRRVLVLFILLETSKLMEGVFFQSVQDAIRMGGSLSELNLLQLWQTTANAGTQTPDQILDSKAQPGGKNPSSAAVRPIVSLKPSNAVTLAIYEPEFMRPVPVFLPISEEECCWILPSLGTEPGWDEESVEVEKAEELLRRAIEGQTDKVAALISVLKRANHIAPKILTSLTLPDLVQRNKTLAVDLLRTLVDLPCFTSLLTTLYTGTITSEAIEVLSELMLSIPLPCDFVSTFISAHIAHAKDIRTEPKLKSFVKKLALFIERLVRDRLIPSEMREEVLEFANDYSRVKEASNLYRLVCDSELYE